MTTFNAPTLQNVAYSGDNAFAAFHGSMAINAQVGDKIRLGKLFAGTKVYNAKLINAALGAGSEISLGYETCPSNEASWQQAAETIVADTAWLSAVSTADAGKNDSASAPIYLAEDFYLVATVVGAAATGQIDVVVEYEFKGNL